MQSAFNRLLIQLLCGSVLLSTVVQSNPLDLFKTRSAIEKEYDKLDNSLVEYLGKINEKPEEHLNLVLSWLKEAQEHGDKVKKTTIEAMLTFTSLLKIMDPIRPNCGIPSMEIAMENEKACGTVLSRPRKDIGQMRRIELIVHLVIAQHATYCRARNPARLISRIQKLDKDSRDSVEEITELLDAVIDSVKVPNREALEKELDPTHIKSIAASSVNWRNKPELYAILNHLLQTVNDEEAAFLVNVRLGPDSQPVKVPVQDENIKLILDNHLFKNCQVFLESFYRIVKPAMYHERFFPADSANKPLSAEEERLLMYSQYFTMCENLLQDNIRPVVEKTIIQAIKDGPSS